MHYLETFHSHSVSPAAAGWLAAMPKVEIHVHLEGAVSPEAVFEMAQRNGVQLPAGSLEEWREFYRFTDFLHFIKVYMATVSCMQKPEDFAQMAEDFLRRQAAQNVVYSEASFSAALHMGKLPADEMLGALEEGLRRGEQKYGCRAALIPDLSREMVDRTEIHAQVLAFACQAKERGIGAALGIGGKEAGFPAEPYGAIFQQARQAGLHVIAHAGEAEGPVSVWGALEALGAERIGHGIRALEDPALVEVLRRRQIPIEVSPQSNYCTRVTPWEAPHPLRQMVDAGLFCTVNSDDPAMFSTDLNNEYLTLAAQGFSLEELQRLNLNGLEASFLPETEKEHLRARFEEYYRENDARGLV